MLRRLTFSAIMMASAVMTGFAQESNLPELKYDWGKPDVIADHMVGPGIRYAKYIYRSKPVIVWFSEIDLSNKYTKVEQVQSRHSVPDPVRWDVMTHYRENDRENHRVKVAWNHDFFSYDGGVCIGLNISEGEVTWNKWGRSLLAISEDGKAEVFYPALDAHVTAPDGTTVVIDYYNAQAEGVAGDCVFYNRMNAKTLVEDGVYVALEPLDKWTVNGDDIRCRVLSIGTDPVQTSKEVNVLYLRSSKRNALDGHLAVGDILTVTQRFNQAGFGVAPERILNAFHGYPSIVRDGKLHDGEFNNFENGREYEKSSRVMAGISKDKTKVYMVTTELSAASTGVDCIELSAWLVEQGAWDVVNFDSGGSAAIVIGGEMLNLPGRGSVRPVVDAMLAVSLAPDDDRLDHMTFSLRSIRPSVISRTPLKVMGFSQYDDVLADDIKGCEFVCEPAELGYVDEDAIFHASSTPLKGVIKAIKDGMTATIEVETLAAEDIRPTYTSMLIDGNRDFIIDITGICDGVKSAIDPGAFTWKVEPEGLISIDDLGIVRGLAEGTGRMTATFENITFDIDFTVEMAGQTRLISDFSDMGSLNYTKSSTLKNFVLDYQDLPEGWNDGVNMRFDLSAGRGNKITIKPATRLYSLPDAVGFGIDNPDGVVTQADFAFVDGKGTRFNISSPVAEGRSVVTAQFTENGEVFEAARYPLTLNQITLTVVNKAVPGTSVGLRALECYYPGYDPASVSDIAVGETDKAISDIIVGASELEMTVASDDSRTATFDITAANGVRALSFSAPLNAGLNKVRTNIDLLAPGIYVIAMRGAKASAKFIVR